MNIVLIIPTGLGAEIGGHAGDANPVVRLLSPLCDNLITHPNVVNASDINEMTENTLYVEGSILDRFLQGEINLKKVKRNRILLAVNAPLTSDTVNSVSASRMTLGADIFIVVLDTPLVMRGFVGTEKAYGEVEGWEELVSQVKLLDFDALAIATKIDVDEKVAFEYVERGGGINPWGAVEAQTSKLIATALNKPIAHSPFGHGHFEKFKEVVDPRLAAEFVSVCYSHCMFKGLHTAPRPIDTRCGEGKYGKGLSVRDVDVMISPFGCFGSPHAACLKKNIPVIIVRENRVIMAPDFTLNEEFILVENYFEAAGICLAIKAGVYYETVRRPIKKTEIINA